jgi:MFS-type transporter involved in bile tolerance (Atg22 family)
LTRLFNVTPAQNGLGLGLGLAVGCLIGTVAASWLVRQMSPRLGGRAPLRISFWTLLAAAPAILLYAYAQSAWQAFLAVGLLMIVGTLIGSLLPGILQGLAPPDLRGRVIALYGVISVLVQGLGVTLVGPISDLSDNPRALLVAVAGLLTVAWAVCAFLMRLSERPYDRLLTDFGDNG